MRPPGQSRVVIFSSKTTTALTPGDTISVNHPNINASGAAAEEWGSTLVGLDTTGEANGAGNLLSGTVNTTQAPDLIVGAVVVMASTPSLSPAAGPVWPA